MIGEATRTAAVLVLVLGLLAPDASGQSLDDLRVGHWVTVKGRFDPTGTLLASELEVGEPRDEEELVGVPEALLDDDRGFLLFGRPMHVSARTDWKGMALDGIVGQPVKVEGHDRGPRKFSVREVSGRHGAGRDRLTGRVDALRHRGDELELVVLGFTVRVPPGVVLVAEVPLDAIELAPERLGSSLAGRDDDDDIPDSLSLGEDLSFGAQLEWKPELEKDFDLDESKRQDARTRDVSVRTELIWEPGEAFFALGGFRVTNFSDREQEQPAERGTDVTLTEAYGYWRDTLGLGVDLVVGRQDFDERREWIYDQNLDAVRLIHARLGLRVELSASTVLADGGRRDRESDNFILYVSNNDEDRHLAAWVVDRRRYGTVREKPIHLGLRALGEWLPDQEVWAEWSLLRGYDEQVDFRGWAVDLGSTWSPPAAEPFSFTLGVARGSGDDDPNDGVDTSFRQTGLQDDNDRFAGVTSFRYYGELLEPELSNLTILTAGVGVRLLERTSLDLVLHRYLQVEAADRLRNANLDLRPNGLDRDLGWELDLVLGSREWAGWDLEVVAGAFLPGDAFPGADDAFVAKLQLRRRF